MNFLVLKYNIFYNYIENFKSENLGLYLSLIFHLVLLLSAIGLPNFFGPKPIMLPTIIPIEIINISDITSVTKNTEDMKPQKTKQRKIEEKKFNSSNNQDIKKINIKDKPKIEIKETVKEIFPKKNIDIKKKKEISLELKKEKIQIDKNNLESLPSKKIKPKLKPKINEKKIKQNLKSDVQIEVKTKPKLQKEFNIASMLKDLRNEKSIQKIDNKNEEIEKKDNIIKNPDDNKSEENSQLSITEIDLVLQQLSRCFIAPAGAEIKKTMFVKISAKIQQNRRVYENSIRIVDTNIPDSSSVYGPITESAMRTLLNPECIPLKLPEDKYETWKNLTMKFDYSIMKGN